jgi:hypothetical protein
MSGRNLLRPSVKAALQAASSEGHNTKTSTFADRKRGDIMTGKFFRTEEKVSVFKIQGFCLQK